MIIPRPMSADLAMRVPGGRNPNARPDWDERRERRRIWALLRSGPREEKDKEVEEVEEEGERKRGPKGRRRKRERRDPEGVN